MDYKCYDCDSKMIVHPKAEDWMIEDKNNKTLWCKNCGIFATESELKIFLDTHLI